MCSFKLKSKIFGLMSILTLSTITTSFMVNAENFRFVVSQQKNNVNQSKSKSEMLEVNISELTPETVCLSTLDSGAKICLDRKYMDNKEKALKSASYRSNKKINPKYDMLTISTDGATINDVQNTLKNSGWFKTVERDTLFTILPITKTPLNEVKTTSTTGDPSREMVPNDPLFKEEQVWLDNFDELFNTWPSSILYGVSHDFIGAWELLKDNNTVPYVMVIDENFIENQPDLTIDDGYNFYSLDGITPSKQYYGLNKKLNSLHGFGVASVIGATTNNNLGIAGAIPDVKITALKALNNSSGSEYDIAMAIRYASGATDLDPIKYPDLPVLSELPYVINLSVSSAGDTIEYAKCTTFMQDSINMAVNAGVSVVVSAGNDSHEIIFNSPANCENVITVTALNMSGDVAYYTNYGEGATIAAQGSYIMGYSLDPFTKELGINALSGTSFSAPIVTSAIALAKKANPNLSVKQLKQLLMLSSDNYRHTAQPMKPNPQNIFQCEKLNCGAGILNAKRLVEMALLYKKGNVDMITHAVTDNMGCDDKLVFDNLGDKLKLCQLYKIKFVGDTLSTSYSLYRSPKGVAFDNTSEKVLTTQDGEIYSANIEADTFDYAYQICTGDLPCQPIWYYMDTSQAISSTASIVCTNP